MLWVHLQRLESTVVRNLESLHAPVLACCEAFHLGTWRLQESTSLLEVLIGLTIYLLFRVEDLELGVFNLPIAVQLLFEHGIPKGRPTIVQLVRRDRSHNTTRLTQAAVIFLTRCGLLRVSRPSSHFFAPRALLVVLQVEAALLVERRLIVSRTEISCYHLPILLLCRVLASTSASLEVPQDLTHIPHLPAAIAHLLTA